MFKINKTTPTAWPILPIHETTPTAWQILLKWQNFQPYFLHLYPYALLKLLSIITCVIIPSTSVKASS
jgi:hypothetical protein